LAAALVLGSGYALASATGDPSVDAVERFHFVEYGIITLLFYRAWRPVGDASLLILPVLAGLLVGTCEEWLQWFVPARVGEWRDVLLNLAAIVCGLLFSIAIDPPERMSRSLSHNSWRRVRRFTAVVLLVFAAFFHSVHLGYRIDDEATGSFPSLYTAQRLVALSQQRGQTWRTNPPVTWSRYSREDQYFSEGITHVRARNKCWSEQKMKCAWAENQILERYYAPVMDTPSYVSATGLRWPQEQRADAARRALNAATDEHPGLEGAPIYTWSKPAVWTMVMAAVAALLL
jgi:hypothetical protein